MTQVCDLDLWAMSMVVHCDTLSCQEEHLWWIIFKIHQCMMKLQLGHDKNVSVFDLWPQFMTLTFEVWTWKLFHIPLRHVGVTARTRQNVYVFYLWPQFMTLTFEVWTWVLVATHRLNRVNICTKLLHIPLRHVGVTDRTSFVTDWLIDGRTDDGRNKRTNERTDGPIILCPKFYLGA